MHGPKRLLGLLALFTGSLLVPSACSSPGGHGTSGSTGEGGPANSGIPDAGEAGSSGTSGTTGGTGGQPGDGGNPDLGQPQVSRTLQLSADGRSLWVVNPESDSLSQIDVASLVLKREVLLAPRPPAQQPDGGRYDPAVRPRALALVDALGKAYVAGQAADAVFVVDTASGQVTASVPVGAEPTAVVATSDGSAVYVVSHEAAVVSRIDSSTDTVTATLPVNEHPWGASLRADGSLLYVSYLLLGPMLADGGRSPPGVTAIDTASFTVEGFTPLPDQPPNSASDKVPNGQVRGEYAVVPRPNQGELWVPHLLLATGTPEPALDFETTAFPTISRLAPGGGQLDDRLLFQPSAQYPGSFIDSVSGPHDVAFTPDGKLALLTLAQSEDVMVFDADSGDEVALVRPTLGSLLDGVVVDASGTRAYVHGRSSNNVTVLDVDEGSGGATLDPLNPDGGVPTVLVDPMPPNLRTGFQIFYSANSAKRPLTQNFWLACASCHIEGQTDAVTWKFLQGPRDTPSNAGGTVHKGFLLYQALRNDVAEYDGVIRQEMGGSYFLDGGSAQQVEDLEDLAAFTNLAIPAPQNPNVLPDGGLTAQQAEGQQLFQQSCAGCHAGPGLTDDAQGNPTLDLTGDAGPITLHDIGTCVTSGPFPDQPSTDIDGDPRQACWFQTPSLRGVFATAPYFHDGSAQTLQEAVARVPASSGLSASDQAALVAYLETL
ncbi:MAG: c-type cytochrome [Myxococcales bacterium]